MPAIALEAQVAVVLVWRLGCQHSRRALELLADLARERVGQPFAALAVHEATTVVERDPARLRRVVAFARDAVTVVSDDQRELLRVTGFAALPGLLLIDGSGEVRFAGAGLPARDRLAAAIDGLLEALAETRDGPAALPLLPVAVAAPTLAPTAIAAAEGRVLIGSRARRSVLAVLTDGEVEREFTGVRHPAGIAALGERVFVSDHATHELRQLELHTGAGESVLGTGACGTDTFGGGFGDQQELAAPTGLTEHGGAVWFAQAATHQIWQFDPDTRAASAILGTGRAGLVDGGEQAEFSEPTGIAANEHSLVVADAASGAVRVVELAHNFVETVAQDLERPVAVALRENEIWVAVAGRPAIVRLAEGGPVPVIDASHGLVEPVGLAFHGDELWIADAGADAVFVVTVPAPASSNGAADGRAESEASQVVVRRVELRLPRSYAPRPAAPARVAQAVEVQEFSDVTLRIHLPCDDDEQLDANAPCDVELRDEHERVLAAPRSATVAIEGDSAPVLVPIDERGAGVLRIRARIVVRVGDNASPAVRDVCYVLPITAGVGGDLEAEVRAVADADL